MSAMQTADKPGGMTSSEAGDHEQQPTRLAEIALMKLSRRVVAFLSRQQ
jgi:hypothetical protein